MNTYQAAFEYEEFVASLYYAVQKADVLTTNLRTLQIEQRKRISNRYGTLREFDIYWEYELDDIVKKVVIECKNYKSTIDIGMIDALVTKLGDIDDDLTPLVATKTGYQSGAKMAADYHGIELLIVREQNDSDWTSPEGTALVRYISLEGVMSVPSQIHSIRFDADKEWVKIHRPDLNTSTLLRFSGLNSEIFIEDRDRKECYSLLELANRLHRPTGEKKDGKFKKTITFKDASIVHPKKEMLRILRLTVDYSTFPPLKQTMNIDFGAALLGVIEYVQRGKKKLLFKDRHLENIVTRNLDDEDRGK